MTEVKVLNDYTWYKGACDAKDNGKLATYLRENPVTLNEFKPGFYRSKNSEGRMTALAFWFDTVTGIITCHLNGKPREGTEEKLWQIFSFAIKGPIRYTNYRSFTETGKWLDESEVAAADREAEKNNVNDPNLPDPGSLEGISARITALAGEAERLVKAGPASTKDDADKAADIKNRLAGLSTAAEAALKGVTGPLNVKLAEARAIWNPLILKADNHKTALNLKVLTPYLAAQKAKLEQEQLAKEQAQRDDNAPIPTRRGTNHQETAKVGSFGRTTHLRETWFVDITDRAKFLDHVKGYPGITDALEKIASSFKTNRPEIPGLSYRKEDKAV